MPFKTFSNGAILLDTDLNDYLMKQAVIQCTSGTRPASPNAGMLVYETDTNRYSSYNGGWLTLGQTVVSSYTPSLTATTTNPTLGTGGLGEGRYTLFGGKWCAMRWTIKFGTSGANAGSGQYLLSLPFQASSQIANGVSTVGPGIVRSAGSLLIVNYYVAASATTMAALIPSGANVTSGSPGIFTNNDYLSGSLVYETV